MDPSLGPIWVHIQSEESPSHIYLAYKITDTGLFCKKKIGAGTK